MFEKIFSRSKKFWWKKLGEENFGSSKIFWGKLLVGVTGLSWLREMWNNTRLQMPQLQIFRKIWSKHQNRHPYKIWSESPISPIHLWSYSKSPLQMPLMTFIVIPDMAQFKCATSDQAVGNSTFANVLKHFRNVLSALSYCACSTFTMCCAKWHIQNVLSGTFQMC